MADLFGIIYGQNTPTNKSSLPALTIFKSSQNEPDQRIEKFKTSPKVSKEITYFQEQLGKIDTVEEFLDDRRLMQFVLSANSLDDELKYPGRINKVLTEDPEEDDALVNRLIDPRFKKIAEELQFATRGLERIKLEGLQEQIIDKYVTNEYEKDLGEQNSSVREALYFKRNIENVDDTFDILGDKTLRNVVLTLLDLPKEIALQSVDKQKSLIDERLDIKKLKDPEFVDKLLNRFLIRIDKKAFEDGLATGGGGVTSLFNNNSGNAQAQTSGLFNLLV